jgi:hypothetical protein
VKHLRLILLAILTVAASSPVFAQRAHPGGGPPAGAGAGTGMGASGSHGSGMGGAASGNGAGMSGSHTDMMHAAPNDVLSHNTAIAGKIKTLTGEDAATACGGFKNLGQCVAAAHVAKNLNIPGGFDALKAKMTGTGSVNLGKAIEQLAPTANAKSESKKANKQAEQDLAESSS